MVLKIAIFQKNDRNLIGKIMHCAGAGKSTTAQLMGREAGYVYFEADCTMNACNPFVPTDVENPTLAAFQQKPLKVNTK